MYPRYHVSCNYELTFIWIISWSYINVISYFPDIEFLIHTGTHWTSAICMCLKHIEESIISTETNCIIGEVTSWSHIFIQCINSWYWDVSYTCSSGSLVVFKGNCELFVCINRWPVLYTFSFCALEICYVVYTRIFINKSSRIFRWFPYLWTNFIHWESRIFTCSVNCYFCCIQQVNPRD